ncbi:hypothetical protein EN850_20845 [Mesorhizobium sp. M8A.F.Ca.ET.207.01.1.1]|nr:hypothetical protein EN850_20845 [Mesorhizobium sp. M8A.F.Ca.ET.207.01.1.1]
MVRACADLVEADATAFLEMFDKMPIGPLMAIANELRSIVPQRHALAGMLYLQARRSLTAHSDTSSIKAWLPRPSARMHSTMRACGSPWRSMMRRIVVGALV